MDCTFGAVDYSKELLKFQETKVVALDRDTTCNRVSRKIKK